MDRRTDRLRAAATVPFVLVTLLLSTFVLAAPARAADPAAYISQGELRGIAADGVEVFRGIPFAQPPVGRLRWRAPLPALGWSGVREATAPGAACIQSRAAPFAKNQSEDCLFINVWRPAKVKNGVRLPVMAWIHGGGSVAGVSTMPAYDGTRLARRNVVVVSFNYRLGALGLFAHPALTAENPKGPLGNYTLLDQIAALKWIKANIAAFGGDPANVTIFGQSAGGVAVNKLMVSPLARGLFAKAISQSGALLKPALPLRGDASATGEKLGLGLAERLGVVGTGPEALAALRALPPEKFAAGLISYMSAGYIDGVSLIEPIDAAFAAGREAKVPYITGATTCELCTPAAPRPADTEAALRRVGDRRAQVAAAYGSDVALSMRDFSGDADVVMPMRLLARLHSRNGQPTWTYAFGYLPASWRNTFPSAPHGGEIPFVFGTLGKEGGGFWLPEVTPGADDQALSGDLLDYWTSFARTGDPGAARGVKWPRFRSPSETSMTFLGATPKVEAGFSRARLDLAEQIVGKNF